MIYLMFPLFIPLGLLLIAMHDGTPKPIRIICGIACIPLSPLLLINLLYLQRKPKK